MVILWLLLACGTTVTPPAPPDPAVLSSAAAVGAFERGKALLSTDPAAALTAFDEALEARPGDVLLDAWRARALADAGKLEEAIAVLDEVLRRRSDFADARYNRAAYLMRHGKVDDAAVDLRVLLDAKAATPRQIMRDADIRPHLGTAALSFLPEASLAATLEVPHKPPFMSSEFDVVLRVEGAFEGPLSIEGDVVGPVEIVRVVEDDDARDDGDRDRVVTWTFVVTGAGEATIGPLTIGQQGEEVVVAKVSVPFLTPEGVASNTRRCGLATPAAASADHDAPSAWTFGTTSWVSAPPDSTVVTTPTLPMSQPWVLRRDGEPVTELVQVRGTPTSVTIRQRGEVRWTGPTTSGAAVPGCGTP